MKEQLIDLLLNNFSYDDVLATLQERGGAKAESTSADQPVTPPSPTGPNTGPGH